MPLTFGLKEHLVTSERKHVALPILRFHVKSIRIKILAICAVVIVELMSFRISWADALGTNTSFLFDHGYRYGERSVVFPDGMILIYWLNPSKNMIEEVYLKQWNLRSAPQNILDLVSGKPATCSLIVASEGVTFADCAFFLGKVSDGATSFLTLAKEYDKHSLGCSPFERDVIEEQTELECEIEETK